MQGTQSGRLCGVMFTCGFRGLDPAVNRNRNCSTLKTVELTDPGKQGKFQMLAHLLCKLFQTGCLNQLGKAFSRKIINMHVSTAFAGWGSGCYCWWQGQQLFPRNMDDYVQCKMCNCCNRPNWAVLCIGS